VQDTFINLVYGLSIATQPQNLFYCLIGVLAGSLIGVLPGLGPVPTIALLLPITYSLGPTGAIIMLAGIYYGAQYGGSTTAILVNMPGENASIVTCIDGHKMAMQGRAGPALAVAALSSLFAGIVTTFFIAFFAPPLANVALLFGPAEYFSLMLVGLIIAVVMSSGSFLKAIAAMVAGMLLACVGTDVQSGVPRMTLGSLDLLDGLDIVPIAMGMFGIKEILTNLQSPGKEVGIQGRVRNLWPSREDFRRSWKPVIRASLNGAALGLLPGGGTTLAAFSSYVLEKKLSKHPEEFGNGAVEGVAAPEAANNAAAQASFIPLLTLGIPTNAVIAVMAGGLMIQGIFPGPTIITDHPDLFWGLIASMLVGNLMLVVINLPLIGVWVQLLKIPFRLFFPMILILCTIGVYSLNFDMFNIYVMVFFGIVGYYFNALRCEAVPFLLAFLLGPMIEENFRRALVMSYGSPMTFFTEPISASLLAFVAVMLAMLMLPKIRKTREVALKED
jgi:putative tricarboxylic transport membrane protein